MFLRLRWLTMGFILGAACWTWLAIRIRRVRAAARPSTVSRRTALRVADALDDASGKVATG